MVNYNDYVRSEQEDVGEVSVFYLPRGQPPQMSAEPKCPCGCTEFRQNLFKEHACSNCLHVHNVELRKFAGTRPAPRVRIDSLPHNTPLAEQLHLVRSPRESDASLRVKVVGEILDSEKSFIYQLGLLESYRKMINDANILPDDIVELIFYGIGSIVELHKSFVILIQERLDSAAHHKVKLGDIFTRICPFLKCHIAYATKHEEGNEVSIHRSQINLRQFGNIQKNYAADTTRFGKEQKVSLLAGRISRASLLGSQWPHVAPHLACAANPSL